MHVIFTNATVQLPFHCQSHHLLSWTYPMWKHFEWIHLNWESNGVFSGVPEQQSTAAFTLYLSCYCCLFPFLLLQVIAELHSSFCTHFWITDWLWVGGRKKKHLLHHFFSLRPGESLLCTGLFSILLTLLWPSLTPCFVLPSFLNFYFCSQVVPISCSPVSPLTLTSQEMLFAETKHAFFGNIVHCNVILTHSLFCFKINFPDVQLCVHYLPETLIFIVATEGHCSSIVWMGLGLFH